MNYLNENDSTNKSEVLLYMNTWGNYNVNGADVENINGGWKTPDEALEWTDEMENKGEEPFINDIDDYASLPFEVNEYDNVQTVVNDIKAYLDLDEYDRKVIGAIIEADDCSYDEALDIFESGDYIFYEDVNNEYDLGFKEVENCGGITSAVTDVETYIDEDKIYDTWEDDLRREFAEYNETDIDNIDEEAFEDYARDTISESIRVAIIDNDEDFFDNWFDYQAFGRDLSFDYVFTKYGAINIIR